MGRVQASSAMSKKGLGGVPAATEDTRKTAVPAWTKYHNNPYAYSNNLEMVMRRDEEKKKVKKLHDPKEKQRRLEQLARRKEYGKHVARHYLPKIKDGAEEEKETAQNSKNREEERNHLGGYNEIEKEERYSEQEGEQYEELGEQIREEKVGREVQEDKKKKLRERIELKGGKSKQQRESAGDPKVLPRVSRIREQEATGEGSGIANDRDVQKKSTIPHQVSHKNTQGGNKNGINHDMKKEEIGKEQEEGTKSKGRMATKSKEGQRVLKVRKDSKKPITIGSKTNPEKSDHMKKKNDPDQKENKQLEKEEDQQEIGKHEQREESQNPHEKSEITSYFPDHATSGLNRSKAELEVEKDQIIKPWKSINQ